MQKKKQTTIGEKRSWCVSLSRTGRELNAPSIENSFHVRVYASVRESGKGKKKQKQKITNIKKNLLVLQCNCIIITWIRFSFHVDVCCVCVFVSVGHVVERRKESTRYTHNDTAAAATATSLSQLKHIFTHARALTHPYTCWYCEVYKVFDTLRNTALEPVHRNKYKRYCNKRER